MILYLTITKSQPHQLFKCYVSYLIYSLIVDQGLPQKTDSHDSKEGFEFLEDEQDCSECHSTDFLGLTRDRLGIMLYQEIHQIRLRLN